MIQGLVKAVVGVFGVASDESVQFYVDVLLGILSAITLLIVVTLLLERRIGWMFAIMRCLCSSAYLLQVRNRRSLPLPFCLWPYDFCLRSSFRFD